MPDQRSKVLIQATYQLIGLSIALFLSVVLAFGCGATIAGRLNAGWIAIGWGLAFFFPAFIIGMLFGIPKSNDNAAKDPKASAALTMNGNFAQISDWITKMITGVTLVNAKAIPTYITNAGKFIGASLKAGDAAASAGSAIAVLFSGLGFIAGYLFTSVYLTQILEDTVRSLSCVDQVVDDMSSKDKTNVYGVTEQMNPTEKAAVATGVNPRQPFLETLSSPAVAEAAVTAKKLQTDSAAEKLRDIPVDPSASAESLELLGNAKMNFGKWDEAVDALQQAIKKDATRYRPFQSLAIALVHQDKIVEAVQALERARPLLAGETASHILQFYEFLTYYCLYLDEPASFQKCIPYAQEFFSQGTDPSGGIWINYACAYGLKAKYKRASDPNANIDAEAAEARKAIEQALKLSANWRPRVLQLMNNPGSIDNDLKLFQPYFKDLVEGVSPPPA